MTSELDKNFIDAVCKIADALKETAVHLTPEEKQEFLDAYKEQYPDGVTAGALLKEIRVKD